MEDLPVVFALYEDLFPVITMDFTDEFIAALEWVGTFESVHAGIISIFKYGIQTHDVRVVKGESKSKLFRNFLSAYLYH